MSASTLTAEHSPRALGTRFDSFAALGDSFTACWARDGRRWTDDLAARLANTNPALRQWNLAKPGATSLDVLHEQIPRALERLPSLVTLVCGANDVLTAEHPDFGGYAMRLQHMIELLRGSCPGVVVITATCPKQSSTLPVTYRARQRLDNGVDVLNVATRAVTRRLGVPYVELGADRSLSVEDDGRTVVVPCDRARRSPDVVDAFALAIDTRVHRVG